MKSVDKVEASYRPPIPGGGVLGPILRLGSYLAAACLVACLLFLRSVRADVAEVLREVGDGAMQYPGVPREGVRQLWLNGARISFRAQTVDAALADVLAYYERLCAVRGAGLANRLRAIATQAARNDRGGYVACLDMGDGPQDLGTLAKRFLRFSNTGDLHDLGGLRYVVARRAVSTSGEKTFLLAMWADSEVNLYRMLPHMGSDAAGRDLIGIPRPSGSQRVLSVWEDRQPSGVFIYRVAAKSAEQLEAFYRRELLRRGWRLIERFATETIRVDGIHMLSAEKGELLVTLLSHSSAASPTVLTILASESS